MFLSVLTIQAGVPGWCAAPLHSGTQSFLLLPSLLCCPSFSCSHPRQEGWSVGGRRESIGRHSHSAIGSSIKTSHSFYSHSIKSNDYTNFKRGWKMQSCHVSRKRIWVDNHLCHTHQQIHIDVTMIKQVFLKKKKGHQKEAKKL